MIHFLFSILRCGASINLCSLKLTCWSTKTTPPKVVCPNQVHVDQQYKMCPLDKTQGNAWISTGHIAAANKAQHAWSTMRRRSLSPYSKHAILTFGSHFFHATRTPATRPPSTSSIVYTLQSPSTNMPRPWALKSASVALA